MLIYVFIYTNRGLYFKLLTPCFFLNIQELMNAMNAKIAVVQFKTHPFLDQAWITICSPTLPS